MPNLSPIEFTNTLLKPLRADQTAFHFMGFAGVYPPDREPHAALRHGGGDAAIKKYMPFQITMGQIIRENGTRIERLRVVPELGQPSYDGEHYDQKDLDAILEESAGAAKEGVAVRTIGFAACSKILKQAPPICAGYAQRYLGGVDTHDPKASFWSIRQTAKDGNETVQTINVMNYQSHIFQGHEIHSQPLEPDLLAYEALVRTFYTDYATPL
ncbi:MAG TPA: hypothetical protein VLE73_02325 [Candidatus Saccharimonadales bacterium]|nr:hypothetical protein [Candidatus Saccharimonadales bacterium]